MLREDVVDKVIKRDMLTLFNICITKRNKAIAFLYLLGKSEAEGQNGKM